MVSVSMNYLKYKHINFFQSKEIKWETRLKVKTQLQPL